MGNQKGNLRQQLVADGTCPDISRAKTWMRDNCVVQYAVIQNDEARRWAEYFVLSVLRPMYCD